MINIGELKMNILSFEFSLDHGFAWIVVDGKKEGDKYTVQCCLEEKDGKFIPKIKSSDCGHNWGLCSDSNEKAFEYWGENRCMNALFNKAKVNGIEVI
jgi:hypothetical protein